MARPLPLSLKPKPREIFQSYIARISVNYGTSPAQLLAHCLPTGVGGIDRVPKLSTHCSKHIAQRLSERFSCTPKAIISLFPKSQWPEIARKDLTAISGVNKNGSKSTNLSLAMRASWCPRCLMEDRAGGQDHYLRHEWFLVDHTICPTHLRPMKGYCGKCYAGIDMPECALYGDLIVARTEGYTHNQYYVK